MCGSLPKTPVTKGDLAWWWNAAVASAAKEKQRCRKTWKNGGSNEKGQAKHLAKHAVYLAKSQAKQVLKDPSPSSSDLFSLANQMRRENLDVQVKNPIRNVYGELCLDDRPKQAAWKEYCERLSNVKFDWDPSSLTELYLMLIPAPTSHLSWWSRSSSWLNVARLLLHSWP